MCIRDSPPAPYEIVCRLNDLVYFIIHTYPALLLTFTLFFTFSQTGRSAGVLWYYAADGGDRWLQARRPSDGSDAWRIFLRNELIEGISSHSSWLKWKRKAAKTFLFNGQLTKKIALKSVLSGKLAKEKFALSAISGMVPMDSDMTDTQNYNRYAE